MVPAWYIYDSQRARVRKVIENGTLTKDRLYLDEVNEYYREYLSGSKDFERETLHVSDDRKRIAVVESKTWESGAAVSPVEPIIRYQYDNHLGSTSLELDTGANIISYEEYHPFGTSAYRMGRTSAEVSLKRYRYVGKERDEESGLYYYGARYYASWLCRFVSVDPLKDDYPYYTPFQYSGNKPIISVDIDGLESSANIGQQSSNDDVNEIHITLSTFQFWDKEGQVNNALIVDATIIESEKGGYGYRFFVKTEFGEEVEFFPTQSSDSNLPNQHSYAAGEAHMPLSQGAEILGYFSTTVDDYTYLGRLIQANPELQEYASKDPYLSRVFIGAEKTAGSYDFGEDVLAAEELAYTISGGYSLVRGLGGLALLKQGVETWKQAGKIAADAAKRTAVKPPGNFGVVVNTTTSNVAGLRFVKYPRLYFEKGRLMGLKSWNNARRYRFPKPKNTDHAVTGKQSNFEKKTPNSIPSSNTYKINTHLDVK